MGEFIKVCQSKYGNQTNAYQFININHIVSLEIVETQNEVNIELLLSNGMRMILIYVKDLEKILGKENAEKMIKDVEEIYESRTQPHLFRRCL